MSAMEPTADDIIRCLGLEPHPEGGHFRETFRDPRTDASGRAASTAIYFLLRDGEVSHWHRVDAAEVWHWYAGGALQLSIVAPDGASLTVALGSNLAMGERPQFVVPADCWQRASSTGAFSLVGCTVAPAFSFAGFELAPADFAPPAAKG